VSFSLSSIPSHNELSTLCHIFLPPLCSASPWDPNHQTDIPETECQNKLFFFYNCLCWVLFLQWWKSNTLVLWILDVNLHNLALTKAW
jgi:hypothetical protein